jgi:predicted nucleic acid-binding protein
MIVLDTNVVSEPINRKADPAVIHWLDQQVVGTLYLTAISLSELLLGIVIMPEGKRKQALDASLDVLVRRLFGARILPFGQDAAEVYARLVGQARASGQAISVSDGQIAAIAALHGFTVATRDTQPFTALGVPVINPWLVKS